MEELFALAAINRNMTVASRLDIENVLKKQKFSASGATEAAWAQVAEALSIGAMLLVSIDELQVSEYKPPLRVEGERYYKAVASVSARLISAGSAEVLWVGRYSDVVDISDPQLGTSAVVSVASAIADSLPVRERAPSVGR